jgi:acyl-CoA thioesterase FadM
VVFGYAIHRADDSRCLATAQTALIALDSTHALSTIPPTVRDHLVVVTPDPVRL